jgi:hypothetical protein
MTNTLGLDDDEDAGDVVLLVERAFDIKFSPKEMEEILTVGAFYDLLLTKIPSNDADRKCASAMAFYRLRSALRRLGCGDVLTPASDTRALERGEAKAMRQLEAECGLHLPWEITPAGCAAALGIFATIMVASCVTAAMAAESVVTGAAVGFVLAVPAALVFLATVDPHRLPTSCATLGDLARRAAAMNYGRLVKMGARHRDGDVWENLTELLSCYALPKAEIARETVFLRKVFEQRTAR